MLQGGNTKNEYLRILVGAQWKPGMTSHEMFWILAGKPYGGPSLYIESELVRRWANGKGHPGYSVWDWLRVKLGSRFRSGDTVNDMLRKLA